MSVFTQAEEQVAELLGRHLNPLFLSGQPNVADAEHAQQEYEAEYIKDAFLQDSFPIKISDPADIVRGCGQHLGCTSAIHVYSILKRCVRMANSYVISLDQQGVDITVRLLLLEEVLRYLTQGNQGATHEVIPFCNERVRQVEEAAFVYNGSFGPIQIGSYSLGSLSVPLMR